MPVLGREHESLTPYYQDEFVTLYCGDCLDVLPTLDPVDLLLTDPPYNIGKDYGEESTDSRDDYAEWCGRWFDACAGLSKAQIVFPGLSNLPRWGHRSPTAVGCWYLPGSPGRGFPFSFVEWEPWLYWGGFLGGSNVIRETIGVQSDVGDHPCPKPLKLFKVLLARTKARSVLDPFAGSGTTLRAAKDLGIRAVGVEIEERFCEQIVRRLGQEVLDFGEAA